MILINICDVYCISTKYEHIPVSNITFIQFKFHSLLVK